MGTTQNAVDLNVIWENDKEEMKKKLSMCMRLGYRHIAVNHVVENLEVKTSKKRKRDANDSGICEPSKILPSAAELNDIKVEWGIKDPVYVYSRVTVKLTHSDQTNRLQKDASIRRYQIISCQPTTDKLLQLACSTLDVDIISLDLTERFPAPLKRQLIRPALTRGVCFEVPYTGLLSDAHQRRQVISNARELLTATKGKNLVLSSGAEQSWELRSPHDAQALLGLLDVRLSHLQKIMYKNAFQCLTHSETTGKRPTRAIVRIHSYSRIAAVSRNRDAKQGEAEPLQRDETSSSSTDQVQTGKTQTPNTECSTNSSSNTELDVRCTEPANPWTYEGTEWFWNHNVLAETKTLLNFMFPGRSASPAAKSQKQTHLKVGQGKDRSKTSDVSD